MCQRLIFTNYQQFCISEWSSLSIINKPCKMYDLLWVWAVSMSAGLTCDPETAMSSSVMMPTQETAWSWPYNVWKGRGVMWLAELLPVPCWLTSHTTQVVSLEPVTRNDPHWSRATHVTRSVNIHTNICCITHASKSITRCHSTLCFLNSLPTSLIPH
jgi:hypothetical protein